MGETKITQAELVEMFGSAMPWEAFMLLFDSPGDMAIGEVRAKLLEMADARSIRLTDTPVDMIEIAARAVARAIQLQPIMYAVDLNTADIARAVIESLREHGPSEAMVEAAFRHLRPHNYPVVGPVWKAMLDALLQSKGG